MPKEKTAFNPLTKKTKSIFSIRLKEVLKKISDNHFGTNGTDRINQKALALDFKDYSGGMDISEQTLSHYFNAKRLPQIDVFNGIVNYISYYFKKNKFASRKRFNSDYLLGLSDSMYKENQNIGSELGFDDDTIDYLLVLKDENLSDTLAIFLATNNLFDFLNGIEKIRAVYSIVYDKEKREKLGLTSIEATDDLRYAQYVLNEEINICIDEITEIIFKSYPNYKKDEIELREFRRKKLDNKIDEQK